MNSAAFHEGCGCTLSLPPSPRDEAYRLAGDLCWLLAEQPADYDARLKLAYDAKDYARAIVELLS